jgi:hypothetical protein
VCRERERRRNNVRWEPGKSFTGGKISACVKKLLWRLKGRQLSEMKHFFSI